MEHFLYLFVDFFSIFFPFIFSFYPKSNFSKKWKFVWPAILITAIPFIVWDAWFTSMGVWGFNSRYLIGISLFGLPLEEILFFICIPYACVFTYEAVNYLAGKDYLQNYSKHLSILLSCFLLFSGILNINKWYTSMTFILTSLFIVLHVRVFRSAYMGKFYFAFLFILIPFFIVNGILTGSGIDEQVVWYNENENLGIRMGTIPFEDTFYGLLMILMSITIFEWMQTKKRSSHTS
ncbi:MAG: lycopene cyclase domain-containing protein [Azospira oryzae]|jgi:lycopene cyclase domain-containing protein|nr:MAG: lycopene cyclase domain-containing protein [Azospira oryzae]